MSATNTVPSAREIDLAEHKLGIFFSDLADVEQAVAQTLEEPFTIDEYLAADEETIKARYAERVRPTMEELAPLLVFTCDLERDAGDLAERAVKLRESVMTLIHEAENEQVRGRWSERLAMLAEWHAEEAARYGTEGVS